MRLKPKVAGIAPAAAMDGEAMAGSTLIKQLASCDKPTRDKALKRLKSWLPLQPHLADDDMKKLWKGLFYCVWHADKAPVQANLIDRLSSLLLRLSSELVADYFATFLYTMRREWSGVDALRLDKFYLLIRRFLHHFFLFLKNNSWDLELLSKLMGVLEERTFLAEDKFPGNGVNYHVATVFLEELRPFLPVCSEKVDVLLKLFLSAMGKSSDKVLVGKIKSNVFDVLLRNGRSLLEAKKLGNDVEGRSDFVVFGTIGLTMGFSSKFYSLGSQADCFQGNRRVLFGLHETFLKLEKDLEGSGIEISIPVIGNDNVEEVPELVPVSIEMEGCISEAASEDAVSVVVNRSAGKAAKKNKKSKKASAGSGKKAETKKHKELLDLALDSRSADKDNENVSILNGGNSNELSNNENLITFDDAVISNLQMQFEKVAAEVGLEENADGLCETPIIMTNGKVTKKRKRVKSVGAEDPDNVDINSEEDGDNFAAKSEDKSAKKVRFSMKNNLVWKPHSPLPPQSLRLPPSVTPRGSALKKGVPPGPIRKMPTVSKKVKSKKGRKGIKSHSPAIKRLKKLRSVSV